jgi:hypothetical protein
MTCSTVFIRLLAESGCEGVSVRAIKGKFELPARSPAHDPLPHININPETMARKTAPWQGFAPVLGISRTFGERISPLRSKEIPY